MLHIRNRQVDGSGPFAGSIPVEVVATDSDHLQTRLTGPMPHAPGRSAQQTEILISPSDILNARILIVDDHDTNVRLLEQMLSGAGYTCVASTMDPREVCALHRTNRHDLILLDLLMPGMDGFQVMEGLQADRNRRLPAGAGHHRPTGSQAPRAQSRREGFHQQTDSSRRGVDARLQHAGSYACCTAKPGTTATRCSKRSSG